MAANDASIASPIVLIVLMSLVSSLKILTRPLDTASMIPTVPNGTPFCA
jgi:hypothetical protein